MFLTPSVESAYERGEAFSFSTECIFYFGRNSRIDFSYDEIMSFELSQRLNKHFFTDIWNEVFELTVAFFPASEMPDENRFPFANDHTKRPFERAERVMCVCHKKSIILTYMYVLVL